LPSNCSRSLLRNSLVHLPNSLSRYLSTGIDCSRRTSPRPAASATEVSPSWPGHSGEPFNVLSFALSLP
jgi:hypothetical protein